jgi:hypothetical protein
MQQQQNYHRMGNYVTAAHRQQPPHQHHSYQIQQYDNISGHFVNEFTSINVGEFTELLNKY